MLITISRHLARSARFLMLLLLLFSMLSIVTGAVLAWTDPSNKEQFDLTACDTSFKYVAGSYNPDAVPPDLTCNDEAYQSANLGKNWAELDLVPHRLEMKNTDTSPATFNIWIGGDHYNGDKIDPATGQLVHAVGWDVISDPVVNIALSTGTCTITTGLAQILHITGGTVDSIVRQLTVDQSAGDTCVIDWTQRLAVGAHLFNGSSLQSYMFQTQDFSQGKRTLSLPVSAILPQVLSKTMAASQNSDHTWSLQKSPTNATLNFGDVCAVDAVFEKPVKITVSWVKGPALPTGEINILVNIYATNPALRSIDTTVTDVIYSGTTQLKSDTFGPVTVPANTTDYPIVENFAVTVPAGTTNINDIATGTYTDHVTNVAIPQTTTAKASVSQIQTGLELNPSAAISDSETITGSGLTFKVDPVLTGAFSNYTPGDYVVGPVDWGYDASSSGSVDFNKTVKLDQRRITTGVLSDMAELVGTDTAYGQATSTVNISSTAYVSLTITKNIPNIIQQGDPAQAFTFHVYDSQANQIANSPVQLTFNAGETQKSATLTGLAPGTYKVTEDALAGWQQQPDLMVGINLPDCSKTVTFNNTAQVASAKVAKVTSPAGFEADWTFALKDGGGNTLETITTTGTGFMNFATQLGEGSYTIVETSQPGWQSDGGVGCSFTVNLPSDANNVFACTFTNTYQPSVLLTKTGDPLSKVGDVANYEIKLENTGSAGGAAGAPSLDCAINDTVIGFSTNVILAPGDSQTFNPTFTVPAGAADPFLNTASATCTYVGDTTTVASSEDTWSTNLFQPSVKLTKTGPDYSKVGDTVTYTVKIENTSSNDSPDLELASFSDTKAAGVTADSTCSTLAPGSWCQFTYTYVVQPGDDSGQVGAQLSNTASVLYHPKGFGNNITGSDTWSLTLLHPDFTVNKTCDAQNVPQAGPADFTVTFENTGDADLVITADDGIGNFDLAAGATQSFPVSVPGPFAGQASVTNSVSASAAMAAVYDLPNALGPLSSSDSCTVGGLINITKLTQGIVDMSRDWQFGLFNGPHETDPDTGWLSSPLATDSSLNKPTGILDFDDFNLNPENTYAFCEMNLPSGWLTDWTSGGVPVTPYNPDGHPTNSYPNGQDLGRRCVDFGAGTQYSVLEGETIAFQINNQYPGGAPRTIGYWKNWSSCSGGRQWETAQKNGGKDAGFWTIDDVLNPSGLTIGSFTIPASGAVHTYMLNNKSYDRTGCQIAVALLGKKNAVTGSGMASDALYGLAAQLIAAKANIAAGAQQPGGLDQIIQSADALLAQYAFSGIGSYLGPKVSGQALADRNTALYLADQLDRYNNGAVGSFPLKGVMLVIPSEDMMRILLPSILR